MMEELPKQTLLIVDDHQHNIDVLSNILGQEYAIKVATNGEVALKIAQKFQPDLILLDVMMPQMDGYEVCRRLKSSSETADIPIVFVTALTDAINEEKGITLGAVDYLTKPVVPAIVKIRVKTHLQLSDQYRTAQEMVTTKTRELEQSQRSAIFMLGEAGHYNDNDTGLHIWRMAAYACALARKVNWHVDDVALLELAAPMHDTGKIGIADEILKAPRRLSDEEMDIMRTHSQIGYQILSKSDAPLFKLAAEIALNHHEKWDGSGYPKGLITEQIPESALIVAIADVFDALTMVRPYKKAWPDEDAFSFIEQQSGSHFSPRLVAAFLDIKAEILEIKAYWNEQERKASQAEH